MIVTGRTYGGFSVNQQSLQGLFTSFKKKRVGTEDSDCAIVEKVWRIYWAHTDKEERCKALTWLLERLCDPDTATPARRNIYLHFYHNRHSVPKKHKELYQAAVHSLPKRKRKKFKKARTS